MRGFVEGVLVGCLLAVYVLVLNYLYGVIEAASKTWKWER